MGDLTRELRNLGERCTVLSPVIPAQAGALRRVSAWLALSARALPHVFAADVVYVRMHPASAIVAALARLAGRPVVQEVNGPNEDFYETWPASRRFRWLLDRLIIVQLRWSAGVAAVTRGLAAWAVERAPGASVRVIANGVDDDRFRPADTRPAWLPASYAVFVGTLAPWQGLEVLIAAATEPSWPRGTQLVIIGDGEGAALVAAAERAHPSRIRAVGALSPDEVVPILSHAAAAVVLSRDRRGTGVSPLKLFEAMACGCPVVVADRPDMNDVVATEGCGIVIPGDDPTSLTAAVRRLVEDRELAERLGAAGREAARQRHTWHHRAVATRELLREAVAAPR